MRRNDGSGEKELSSATEEIFARTASKDAGWNRRRSCRLVISRVLEGGVGWDRGGRLERSRESWGLWDVVDDVLDR